jgi:hypothetical protein
MRVPLPAASAPLPAAAPPPARLRQQPPRHRPSQPVRPSQPTRSRPTPPQRQTSGSEQRENQGAPARQQGQRPRQSICPCARRVQNGFCHQVRRTCTPQANRSSQSACGGPATVGSAPGFYINVGLFADEQCAQGAVSAAERGAARVSPDAGWRQGHPRARAGGALCVAQPGRGRCRHSQKRWDWKPWCSASSPHGKTSVDKTSFVNTEPHHKVTLCNQK